RHIMDANPQAIPQTATIREAIALFAQSETSGIPVVDDANRVVGFVSDGDVMKYIGRNDSSFVTPMSTLYRLPDDDDILGRLDTLLNLNVMQIATEGKVITVDADTPIDEACHMLASKQIKKLPVVEGDKLVGTLSRRNVIHAISENAPDLG
ncbi:MAG: CBS domain-containing protein, partial [Coriobacteriaceae bacterium]|nr:CBS domain-containing protein [Coriobacteriaceae bacterium]